LRKKEERKEEKPDHPYEGREGEGDRRGKGERGELGKRNSGASWKLAEKEEALRTKISWFRTPQQTSLFNCNNCARFLLLIILSFSSPNNNTNSIEFNCARDRVRLGLKGEEGNSNARK